MGSKLLKIKEFVIYSCANCVFNWHGKACTLNKQVDVTGFNSPDDMFPEDCQLVLSEDILVKIGKQ